MQNATCNKAELALARSTTTFSTNLVALYKALGDSWAPGVNSPGD